MDQSLSQITKAFGVGECLNVSAISIGKVNTTFQVVTEQGYYILQLLKPPLGEHSVIDGYALTEHLINKGFPVPRFNLSCNGDPYVKSNGRIYRLMNQLPGRTVGVITTEAMAYTTGRLVGRFHLCLKDFHYVPRSPAPWFHDLEQTFLRLKELSSRHSYKDRTIDAMIERLEIEVPSTTLPASLPKRCIHGDLKYTNILYNDDDEAIGLLDFDTLMVSTLPVEMGDAFRSWCTLKSHTNKPAFEVSILRSGWQGYLSIDPPVSPEEKKWIPTGIKSLLLELCCRYLIDVFEDYYFAWDSQRFSDRRSHNLFRAARQLAVFDEFHSQEELIVSIIEQAH